MKSTLRLLAALAAAPLLMAAAAPDPTYSITYPAGWTAQVQEGLVKADNGQGSANCNSYPSRVPDLVITQSEINDGLVADWAVADWAGYMGVAPDKIQLIETHARRDGAFAYRSATIYIPVGAVQGQTTDMYAYIAVSMTPGWAFNAGCYARTDVYPTLKGTLQATVDSLRVK